MITLISLLDDMTDRDRLARWPLPAYRTRQFSSYDRSSVAPDRPGWFGNRDYNEFLGRETVAGRTEWVLVDVDGPGAVVRFWNALGGALWDDCGILRFYLDHQATPAIEAPLTEVVGGSFLAGNPFSYVLPDAPLHREENYLARNLFLPIPFARHCKITWECRTPAEGLAKPADGGHSRDLFYYNIECLTFDAGTAVQTFSMDVLKHAAEAIRATGRALMEPEKSLAAPVVTTKRELEIAPGSVAGIFSRTEGAGAIRRLRIALEGEHEFRRALRATIVEIVCDGEPCVWCPAGDFFGTGPDLHPHTTWFTLVHECNWMQSRWVMPFARSCEIRLRNLDRQKVFARVEVDCGSWAWDDRSMHFRAAWRAPEVSEGPEHVDRNLVTIEGRGVYVGDALSVLCSRPCRWDSTWWGEGDEKIYVDGASFPSHFGTGTEDYYGYAWCRPNFFERPWHAQPMGRGNKRGGLSVNCRYRLWDAIPFAKSLRFDLELWLPFRDQGQRAAFGPATFFYAMPGAVVRQPVPDPAGVLDSLELAGRGWGDSL
jgi:hypothetical protein